MIKKGCEKVVSGKLSTTAYETLNEDDLLKSLRFV